jgi:hypothetical protein
MHLAVHLYLLHAFDASTWSAIHAISLVRIELARNSGTEFDFKW